jgi:hypothetical protein
MNKIRITPQLIAPCGMDCKVCLAYLREKKKCNGCRGSDIGKSEYCISCIIRNCDELKINKLKFCSLKCKKYPCRRLKNLDKRYKTKYNMSMIENLENIGNLGIRKFVKNEESRWTCTNCGSVLCVHRTNCLNCGSKKKISAK